MRAFKRARRLQRLRAASGRKALHGICRAGVSATALWGVAVKGIPPGELRALRVACAKSSRPMARGASVHFRLGMLGARRWDPVCLTAGEVVYMWAEAVWCGSPTIGMLETVLVAARQSAEDVRARRSFWKRPRSVPDVLLRRLEDLQWHAHSARKWTLHNGLTIDLVQLAPAALPEMAVQAACWVSDIIGQQKAFGPKAAQAPVHWQLVRAVGAKLEARKECALQCCIAGPSWTQDKFFRRGMAAEPWCQQCFKQRGTIAHRRLSCSAWVFERGHGVDHDVCRWASSLPEDMAEQFCRGVVVLPIGFLPKPLEDAEADTYWWPAD